MEFFEISFVRLISSHPPPHTHTKLHHLLKSQDKEKDTDRFFVTVVNTATYKGNFWGKVNKTLGILTEARPCQLDALRRRRDPGTPEACRQGQGPNERALQHTQQHWLIASWWSDI